jgi:ribosomal protein S18 acetylase RimI-like enzyme
MHVSRILLAPGGPEFSRIAFGLWRLAEWRLPVEDRSNLLEQCLELGVTTMDHADIYGDYQAETLFGEALARAPSLRQRIELVTKCGISRGRCRGMRGKEGVRPILRRCSVSLEADPTQSCEQRACWFVDRDRRLLENGGVDIRSARAGDDEGIAAILEPIVRAGETYALPRDWSRGATVAYWRAPGHDVFVAETGGAILGTYFVCANQSGGGAHVANAGYATAQDAQGRGIARAMCLHSLDHARTLGFRAMQFNFVVSTNARAIALWRGMGFSIVGTLPAAFAHPTLGYVDAFVMYRTLA